jgi:hypothetical protein
MLRQDTDTAQPDTGRDAHHHQLHLTSASLTTPWLADNLFPPRHALPQRSARMITNAFDNG